MAKLNEIDGIAPDEAELLEATGWSDVPSLAKADPDVLTREVSRANEMLKITVRTPDRNRIERWIAAAREATSPGAGAVKPVGTRAKKAAKPSEGGASRKRSSSRSQPVQPELLPVQPERPPVAVETSSAEADRTGESALAAISGSVDFESDPEVIEMLAVAPFAIPIPARQLAEKGIPPAEIAVAALLNRAHGDLDVRVMVEKAPRPNLPETVPATRRATAVQVGITDPAAVAVRRGFDPDRVRSIEEAQADGPQVKASASKAGMQDERIALLRSPLPSTNRGRKPSSRFYIRGVLHDRPYRVWFGGLITVLLQLLLPLAIVSAPLLILSDENPERFAWVPGWIIAFPLAVPILGLMFALFSTGAKCRVCAQRMYVPKSCLKNRKAHHLPFLGYIGAVALHVMVFRWHNCTFCGTSIRIKK